MDNVRVPEVRAENEGQTRQASVAEHPVAAGLGHLRKLDESLSAELGPPPGGWKSLSRLSSDRSLLEDVVQRNALGYGGTRRIAANFVVGGVTWAVGGVPLALMAIECQAIALQPDSTFLHLDARGEAGAPFYDDPIFCVLQGDIAARHISAVVVEDVSALHEWMRSQLVDSLTPFVHAMSDLTGLGRRGLWGQVASSCGSVIVWAAELAGRGNCGIMEADAFLNGPGAASLDPPSFYRPHLRGARVW